MNKDTKQQIAALNDDSIVIDSIVEGLDSFMAEMVRDNVTSGFGALMLMWDPKIDVEIVASLPLVDIVKAQELKEDEYPDAVGMQIGFAQPIPTGRSTYSSVKLPSSIMISAITTIKKKLLVEQGKLDKRLTKLMEQKKGDQ